MTIKPIIGTRLLAVLAAMLLFSGPASAAEDAALDEVRGKISTMFEAVNPENINPSPVDGWYTIQMGSVIAYVSADGRYLLQGDLIDLDLQVNLTEKTRNDARRVLMTTLDNDRSIMFSPAEVKHTVTVFTDIDCGYCRKLHSQIDEYLDNGIQVRYLLYPRNGPASKAWSTSEEVWCARDRNAALTAAKLDRAFETNQCDASAISDHYMLGRDIGLSGTPAIVLEDGTLIGGYLPPAQLAMRLEQSTPE